MAEMAPIKVQVEVLALTPVQGVPVLIAPIADDTLEVDQIRDVAEQIRDQIDPAARVIVVHGMTLDAARADQAMHLLRVLAESFDTEPVAAFTQQFDAVRQFVAAVDADTSSAQDEDPR